MTSPQTTLGAPDDINTTAKELGFKQIRAWVADAPSPKATNAAERTRRTRKKAEAAGIRQLSIAVPIAQHTLFKTMAEQMRSGLPVEICLRSHLGAALPAPVTPQLPPSLELSGWRGWLLKMLLPNGLV
jgi:hypothetical protein